MTKIIGISGIGGAGKSALTKELGRALNVTTLHWDDFDEISTYPDDYIAWYNTTRDYSEWKYDALANVLKQLKMGHAVICPATKRELIPTDFIIFDAPLGRKHEATGQYIDYLIFLNTPLDVALARRMLRDFRRQPHSDSTKILNELDFYLTTSRPLYAMVYENHDAVDLVLDGNLSVEKLAAAALEQIKNHHDFS